MKTYRDDYLEYYADRFVRLRLSRLGISLPQYLSNIEECEQLLMKPEALAPEPLLPTQAAVALRLWWAWDTGLATATSEPADIEPYELPGEYAVWEEFLLGLGNNKAIRQRNGAFVEPMHHHRHKNARNSNANFARKGA